MKKNEKNEKNEKHSKIIKNYLFHHAYRETQIFYISFKVSDMYTWVDSE